MSMQNPQDRIKPKSLFKCVEPIINITIIVLVILIGISFVKAYLLADHEKPDSEIVAGTKLSLLDVDWAKKKQTLLLVLQEGCHFCSESAPFYQHLTQSLMGRDDIRLIAVLPHRISEGKRYLNNLGVSIDEVRQATPSSLGARGTPTLILVDNAGVVTKSWIGKLTSSQETEVLTRLQVNAVAAK